MGQIKKYIRGNANRGHEVIAELEKLGGKNILNYQGTRDGGIYHISSHTYPVPNTIHIISEDSFTGQLILTNPDWEEIELPKKDKYPKSFLDCCKILYPYDNLETISLRVYGHKGDLLTRFQQLLICRDAYWKLYGEENGLGRPWEPDWSYGSNSAKYCIVFDNNNVSKMRYYTLYSKFSFSTEEMRDAFYDNFKELIEDCKELL